MKFEIFATMEDGKDFIDKYGNDFKKYHIQLEKLEFLDFKGKSFPREIATVEINSLEELNVISKLLDHPIILANLGRFKYPTLEVYDDYRE